MDLTGDGRVEVDTFWWGTTFQVYFDVKEPLKVLVSQMLPDIVNQEIHIWVRKWRSRYNTNMLTQTLIGHSRNTRLRLKESRNIGITGHTTDCALSVTSLQKIILTCLIYSKSLIFSRTVIIQFPYPLVNYSGLRVRKNKVWSTYTQIISKGLQTYVFIILIKRELKG